MTPKAIKKTVNAAWYAMQSAANSCVGGSDVNRMLELSSKAERSHRAFGKRFTNGQCGYRVSVDTAAKLIALHQFAEQLSSRKVPNVLACGSVRPDVVQAWYLAERLKRTKNRAMLRELRKAMKPVLAIDYAKDCAK